MVLIPQCTCCVLRSSPIYSSSAGLFSQPVDVIARESSDAFAAELTANHTWTVFFRPRRLCYGSHRMLKSRALYFLGVCSLVLHAHSTNKCPSPCKPRVSVCYSVVSHSCYPIMRFLLQQASSWKDLDV